MQTHDELVDALQAALEWDNDINLHEYPIKITYQDSLRLEGEVENIIAKRKIRRIAQHICGHSNMEDHLYLRTSEQRLGKSLRDAVIDALSQEPAFRDVRVFSDNSTNGENIQWMAVHAEGRVVRLDGTVGSLSHRRLAEVICWWVPGTGDVHNHLRVKPPEQDSDGEITDAVLMVLEKDPMLHAENITPTTRANVVSLNGTVHNQEQARMAVYDCWYIPGVHDVMVRLRFLQ